MNSKPEQPQVLGFAKQAVATDVASGNSRWQQQAAVATKYGRLPTP